MAGRQAGSLFAGWFTGSSGSGTSRPAERDRYTLDELRRLHEVLTTNAVVTDANRAAVVEALRALAELMCWDDQHGRSFFDFFLDNNLMRHFSRFLEAPANRRGEVAKQVLQTLYILISNVSNPTSIYYIFSNNHVNDIITLPFDFTDDEVLGYYINLLKTISLRVTASTVQFFFQDDGERCAFPLYTEAIKLVTNGDSMVRAAVRTITLKVYSLEDVAIQSFLVSRPASNYFTELAILTAEQCQVLDRKLSSLEAGTSAAAYAVEAELTHAEDLLSYANDVLVTGQPALSELLLGCLWELCMRPLLLRPLQQLASPQADEVASPLCALCLAERLLDVLTHAPTANRVACSLLGVERSSSGSSGNSAEQGANSLAKGDSCRDGLLAALRGGEAVSAAAAVRVVWALLQNQAVDPDVLDCGGLLPQQQRENRQLLQQLTADGGGGGSGGGGRQQRGLFTEAEAPGLSRRASGAWEQLGPSPPPDWGDALCSLLPLDLLPCSALWVAGRLLLRLLAKPKSGVVLSRRQADLLRQALAKARRAFAEVVAGPWTDALPMLIALEWERAGRQLAGPLLASAGGAVQAWMQAVQARKLASAPGPGAHDRRSAWGAAVAAHAVQRLTALCFIQQGLADGGFAAPLPVPRCSEAALKRGEVREGMLLTPRQPRRCSVSFSRGVERAVLFAVYGLPAIQVPEPGVPGLSEEMQAGIASTSPSVLLVAAASSGPGEVLSVAPLVGTEAHTDAGHPRWLHVHVRPNTRGMLKAVRSAQLGELAQKLQEQLADGHWVLAFPSAGEAQAAQAAVSQQAGHMRALLAHVLSPLTQPQQEEQPA